MGDKCPDSGCKAKKVSWKALGITVIALIGIFTTVVLYGMASEKKQNDKIAEVKIVQKDVEHIKGQLKEVKTAIKELKSSQMTPEKFTQIVRDALGK